MLNLKNIWVDVGCTNCKYEFDIRLIEVKLQSKVFCHNCKSTIQLIDQDASVYTGMKKIEDQFNKLLTIFK